MKSSGKKEENRPRVVFISPEIPYPLDSGIKIRIYHLLECISQWGIVEMVCFIKHNEDKTALSGIQHLCEKIHCFPLPPPFEGTRKPSLIKRLKNHVFSFTPSTYRVYSCSPFIEMVDELGHKADLVWIERLTIASYLKRHRNKMIVDLDDLEWIKKRRTIHSLPLNKYLLLEYLELFRLWLHERLAIKKFLGLVVCSKKDQVLLGSKSQVMLVPNGIDESLFQPIETVEEPYTIVFTGRMRYKPNQQAVLHFYNRILPLIRKKIPGAKFMVVGAYPPPQIKALAQDQNVIVTGWVPDIKPYVASGAVSVVPLLTGGGTRIKILEALALAKAVVSTSVGAEGLDLVPDKHLVIKDTPEDFARATVELLQNPEKRKKIGEAGKNFIRQVYGWSTIYSDLQSQLNRKFISGN